MAIKPTVDKIGDSALTDSIIDRSITEFQDEVMMTLQPYALASCSSLKKGVFGGVTEVLNDCFSGDEALATLDFHAPVEFDASALQGLSGLKTLILRSNTMCDASSGALLSYTPIDEGTGYIYVPAALVDSYKSDFIWSSYADQIRAIEDYQGLLGTAGKEWTKCTDDGKSFNLIAYANGVWVAGAYGLYYSDDGITWTKALTTSIQCGQILYADGIWMVAGGNNKKTYVSTDGKSWTTVSTRTDGLAYGNGVFVGKSGSSGLVYSADGLTWTQSNVTGTIRDVVYADGFFLATAGSNNVYKSVDGVTWETFAFPGGSIGANRLAYGNGIFVLSGLLSDTYSMYFSTDGGETWTRSPQSVGVVNRVSFRNGLFHMGETNGGVWVSSDGESWEKTSLTSAYINFVQYDNGIWLTSVDGKMYYSYDGLEWVEATPSFSAYAAAFDGSKWVAASSAGLYYSE